MTYAPAATAGTAAQSPSGCGAPGPPGLRAASSPSPTSCSGRRWEEAARPWTGLGCPYEAALALHDAGDEAALREA